MNIIGRRKERVNLNILEWRRRNLELIKNEYIPFLISKTETEFMRPKKIWIKPVRRLSSFEGYTPENLRIVKSEYEVLTHTTKKQDSFVTHTYIPWPNEKDVFVLGEAIFILINVFMDEAYGIHRHRIKSTHFQIDPQGTVLFSTYRLTTSSTKQRLKTPLYKLIMAFGILDRYLTNPRFLDPQTDPNAEQLYIKYKNDGKIALKLGSIYLITEDYLRGLKPVQRLIYNSIKEVKRKSDILMSEKQINDIVKKFFFVPVPIRNEFTSNYTNTIDIIVDALDDYNEYAPYTDLHLRFKRLKYAELLFEPFQEEIARLRNISKKEFQEKGKIGFGVTRIIKAFKMSKFKQYVNLNNPLHELAIKTKLTNEIYKVSATARDVSKYQAGHICPIDTPDSEKVGINLYAVPEIELDDYGRFITDKPPIVNRAKIGIKLLEKSLAFSKDYLRKIIVQREGTDLDKDDAWLEKLPDADKKELRRMQDTIDKMTHRRLPSIEEVF